MLKVAKLSEEPEQSLIPSSKEVNVDDTADKSLSIASVQPVTQPKAPTDLKTKRKRIPPSSKPESQYKVRVISPKKPVAETQHAKVIVATVDATKSQQPLSNLSRRDRESESALIYQIFYTLCVCTQDAIIDITPKDDEGDASDTGLHLMPDDDLASLTGFKTQDSSDHFSDAVTETLYASADKPAQSDPLGHLHEELCLLNNKVNQLESNIANQVSATIQSSVPLIVADTLKEQLPGLLKDALKDTLPQLIKDSIKNSISTSIAEELAQVEAQDLKLMFKDMFSLLEAAKVFKKANVEGEKWEKNIPEAPHPDQSKGEQDSRATTTTIIQGEQSSAQPDANKMTMDQFTEHLTNTTLFIFSHSPPREPTPPRDEHKGKGIATEDPIKDIMPFLEEEGSAPKIPNFKSFVIPEGQLTQEDVMAHLKEMKRLADLKVEKEKSEKSLKKILNPATIRARTQKMAEHEAKRKKDEATIRITRANDPLNITVHERFRLKSLGFSKWLEVHSLASKTKRKSNDMLLQSLRAKFEWVLNQVRVLGTPPPPELSSFGIPMEDGKRKRTLEILQQVFVKENIAVDGMKRNLAPPPGVECRKEAMKSKLSAKYQLAVKGLSECKASESNIRYIQVRDIVKEVEDHLKTYSSDGMDISWYVEGIC
ncbi:hypothetical protein Tco_1239138 [Tanacetum coccineum]